MDPLETPVADALARPEPGARITVEAAGLPFSALTWGDGAGRPLLLVHGITASAEIWWRVAPALAATGRRVVAVDLPGHGRTGHWAGRQRFLQTAEDLAAFIAAAGLAAPELQVIAHSWGAMVAVTLPAAGLRPSTLVLLDPPVISQPEIVHEAMEADVSKPSDRASAAVALAAAHPAWADGDVQAAVDAAMEVDLSAAAAILFENGDWDAGLAELAGPAAAGLDVRVVRGDPATGGRLPDASAAVFAERYGADHVIMLVGAPHSPQATHPEALVAALLESLG